ncbi:MAG: acylphosphatase [Actinomycetota bacterium]|nr:acylphosphatase [Actinomycetota bacterium]
MADIVRKRVVVRGVVQGVWFRAATRDAALKRGISGWVRNLPDRSVEAVFEGASDAVDSMVAWCRTGPERAIVERVEVAEETPEGLLGFSVR